MIFIKFKGRTNVKATETNIHKFLQSTKQFIIPIYQRRYSWTLKQCKQLWDDLLHIAVDEDAAGHFIGSVVYVEKGIYHISDINQLLLIDGQQRITTLSLLFAALGRVIEERNLGIDLNRKKIEHYYLLNTYETDNKRFKLLLTQSDQPTYAAIIENQELPKKYSYHIKENFDFFYDSIKKSSLSPELIYQGLLKLIMVDISLDKEKDNPQLIFESLNSTGLDLSQADLIRNYILMGLEPVEQNRLYSQFWHPIEEEFSRSGDPKMFDRFMRDYLTIVTGKIPNISDVYSAFKEYSQSKSSQDMSSIVCNINKYAQYYARMLYADVDDKGLKQLFKDINDLKVDVVYPFLLEVYDDYNSSLISKSSFISVLRLVESYIFRRAICGIPTNSLNKTFANLGREIDKENYLESLQDALYAKSSYTRFPHNDEFVKDFKSRDIYNLRIRNYILSKLENYNQKEKIDVSNYTIEHIMPQNPVLSDSWKSDLGHDWQEIQAKYLHTIGNLTLTGYNSELSDRSFIEKRDMEPGGFSDSHIRLNKVLAKLTIWNEEEILKRAEDLAEMAIKIWPSPTASPIIQYTNQISVKEILFNVFPHNEDIQAVKSLLQLMMNVIDYDKVNNILSVTYREKTKLSVCLGQWLVLRFHKSDGGLNLVLALDTDLYPNIQSLKPIRVEPFSERWTGGRKIQLAEFPWTGLEVTQELVASWASALQVAFTVFHRWPSTSHMRYHHKQLADFLFERNYERLHLDYVKGTKAEELFDSIRKRIINLDPAIREEFKKYYVAYKLDTNFVDIMPQKSNLKIWINLPFTAIYDPKGLCKDMTNIGHWGNGDIEITMDTKEQIEDILALINQSYKKHQENGD